MSKQTVLMITACDCMQVKAMNSSTVHTNLDIYSTDYTGEAAMTAAGSGAEVGATMAYYG